MQLKGLRGSVAITGALTLVTPALAQVTWQAVPLHQDGNWSDTTVSSGVGARQFGHGFTLGATQPLMWGATADSLTRLDVTRFGWTGGQINGASGTRQVGSVYKINSAQHAVAWSGTSDSLLDLHPTSGGYGGSLADGIAGDMVVGTVTTHSGDWHAATWNLHTNSFVDLHPAGASISGALASDGVRQGGAAYFLAPNNYHAVLWNGSATDYLDLNPAGARESGISDMVIGAQVGRAVFGVTTVAALWRDTPESFINLAPAGATRSFLYATLGDVHAGYASINGTRAGVWFGEDPDSFVDLHKLLPPGFDASIAYSISRDGDTYYVGGIATRNFHEEAMLWVGTIPAPGSLALASMFGLTALSRRRR